MTGMLAGLDITRCDKSDMPAECFKWNHQFILSHAFIFFTQHHKNLSSLAEVAFADYFEGYEKAAKVLYKITQENSNEYLCSYTRGLSDEFESCIKDINKFKKAAEAVANE